MNKAVVASLLMVASLAPQISKTAFGQTQPDAAASGAQAGQVQMSAAEYAAYNSAIGQTTPQTKAPALESYLTAYPQSAVKADVLQQLMLAYSSFDPAKTIDAADRLLQVDPNNRACADLRGVLPQAERRLADRSGGQAGCSGCCCPVRAEGPGGDQACGDERCRLQDRDGERNPDLLQRDRTAALNKKDTATAITNFKSELASVPVEQTTKPGPILQDTYFLGLAYLQSTPPDLVNCAFYVARFVAFAPEPYKSQMLPTAQYCYKKFHGNADGYDQVATAAAGEPESSEHADGHAGSEACRYRGADDRVDSGSGDPGAERQGVHPGQRQA